MEMTEAKPNSCAGTVLHALLFLWVTGVAFLVQSWIWVGAELGVDVDPVLLTLLAAALIALPTTLLAWIWRGERGRALYRAWALSALYLALLAPSRWIAPSDSQLLLATQLLISTGVGLLLWLVGLQRKRRNQLLWATPAAQPKRANTVPAALAFTALLSYPWLIGGALGSLLDLAIALALGLAAAWVAVQIWALSRQTSVSQDRSATRADLLFGGMLLGTSAAIGFSGVATSGLTILLMIALPALGWLAAALSLPLAPLASQPGTPLAPTSELADGQPGVALLPALLLLGGGAGAILAFVDLDVTHLQLFERTLLLNLGNAGVVLLVGWGMGLLIGWGGPYLIRIVIEQLHWRVVAAAWAVAVMLYVLLGLPGFYGDKLLVIMATQADVDGAYALDDYQAKREAIYATLTGHAQRSQHELLEALGGWGGNPQSYYLLNAVALDGGLPLRIWLRTRVDVDRVLPLPVLRPLRYTPTPATGMAVAPSEPPWNVRTIGADRVWTDFGVRGEGIVIGQSDSGVQADHPELAANYRGRGGLHDYNWLDPWSHSPVPFDESGHGTHTLGSIVGAGIGVAPGAEWFGCANLQRNLGNAALYLDCLQFMLAPYPRVGNALVDGVPQLGAHVINNSWGCPQWEEGCDATSLQPAVEALRAAGLFVVASAGNSGPRCGTVTDPLAIYGAVFSVGATTPGDHLANFSSTGPVLVDGSGRLKPDILAPGARIISAFPGTTYEELAGTSMAGPHVAGVVALMWSANPALIGDVARTEEILIRTARPFTGTLAPIEMEEAGSPLSAEQDPVPVLTVEVAGNQDLPGAGTGQDDACIYQVDTRIAPNPVSGYGIVNAYAAVQAALELAP
jgi:subtilisin family serine protease